MRASAVRVTPLVCYTTIVHMLPQFSGGESFGELLEVASSNAECSSLAAKNVLQCFRYLMQF